MLIIFIKCSSSQESWSLKKRITDMEEQLKVNVNVWKNKTFSHSKNGKS